MAVSPSMVSGRVVATIIRSSVDSYKCARSEEGYKNIPEPSIA